MMITQPVKILDQDHQVFFEILLWGDDEWMPVEMESGDAPFGPSTLPSRPLFFNPKRKFPMFSVPEDFINKLRIGSFMRAFVNAGDGTHRILIRGWLYRGGMQGWVSLSVSPVEFEWFDFNF